MYSPHGNRKYNELATLIEWAKSQNYAYTDGAFDDFRRLVGEENLILKEHLWSGGAYYRIEATTID